jgi:hypothetical protein
MTLPAERMPVDVVLNVAHIPPEPGAGVEPLPPLLR